MKKQAAAICDATMLTIRINYELSVKSSATSPVLPVHTTTRLTLSGEVMKSGKYTLGYKTGFKMCVAPRVCICTSFFSHR
jgi:hypothetical protein